MKFNKLTSYLTLIFLAVFLAGFMKASAVSADPLPAKLEKAIAKLEASQDQNLRFAFERQTFKAGIKTEIKAFDPARSIPERWDLLLPAKSDTSKDANKLRNKYAESDGSSDTALIIPNMRARLAKGASLLRSENGVDVFGFDIADIYILEGGGMETDIAEHILGEIAIDHARETVSWIKYYAPQSFKPISIVRLNTYEIVQHLAPAWENGPMVRVYETSRVFGSAPFTSIKVDEIMINEGFEQRSETAAHQLKNAGTASFSGQK